VNLVKSKREHAGNGEFTGHIFPSSKKQANSSHLHNDCGQVMGGLPFKSILFSNHGTREE
jgi:hypothetical protein